MQSWDFDFKIQRKFIKKDEREREKENNKPVEKQTSSVTVTHWGFVFNQSCEGQLSF